MELGVSGGHGGGIVLVASVDPKKVRVLTNSVY
jgi:hypothetical protein